MKEIIKPVAITTLILVFYLISVYSNMVFAVVFMLFLMLNFFTIWMVIRVLKDGQPSQKTFDDYWYEDMKR